MDFTLKKMAYFISLSLLLFSQDLPSAKALSYYIQPVLTRISNPVIAIFKLLEEISSSKSSQVVICGDFPTPKDFDIQLYRQPEVMLQKGFVIHIGSWTTLICVSILKMLIKHYSVCVCACVCELLVTKKEQFGDILNKHFYNGNVVMSSMIVPIS